MSSQTFYYLGDRVQRAGSTMMGTVSYVPVRTREMIETGTAYPWLRVKWDGMDVQVEAETRDLLLISRHERAHKLTPIQLDALIELAKYRPNPVPPPVAGPEQWALRGLAMRPNPLVFSFTENGKRRYQLSPEGELCLESRGKLPEKY